MESFVGLLGLGVGVCGLVLIGFILRIFTREGFACAINCMDGRTQSVIHKWMRRTLKVKWVDTITEAGPVRILAENTDEVLIRGIKTRLSISVNRHHSKVVAIVAHDECAGNPVSKEEQIAQLRLAKETVEAFGFNAKVVILWVPRGWKRVERIDP